MRALYYAGIIVALLSTPQAAAQPLNLSEGRSGPWWAKETALTKTGDLRLSVKPWWERALNLEQGESFKLLEGRAIVRRETVVDRSGTTRDCIVWVIDDDEDGSVSSGGDTDSDCYVVDYGRDGKVDRMVDYIDNDDDGDPDEMDIRYFVDGELRYCWFGVDLDDDSAMWSLRGYEYGGPSFFESDPYGDSMIYMNKLDTVAGTWSPISECPFAFYDTDKDGQSEITIRCSAVPLSYDPSVDPDFANDYAHFAAPWNNALSRMGIVNIRYSFDIDGGSSDETPLSYDFGFNLVGAAPYEFEGMRHVNPKRRPPQTTIVTPWEDLRGIADAYAASETGFSWQEYSDDTIAIGYGDKAEDDQRWEGVFWNWERRFMENTGGPNQKWNMRREYSAKATTKRTLYYSGVDKRIHLKGAEEGWIQVGHFAGLDALGEIRMFDTDDNGYFDRWEYDFGAWQRTVTVRDERAEDLPVDIDALTKRYTEEFLPDAVAKNKVFLKTLATVHPFEAPEELKRAAAAPRSGFQRYAQDILRELHCAGFLAHWSAIADAMLEKQPMDDLRRLDATERAENGTSAYAWKLRMLLTEVDVLCGQGKLEEAAKVLAEHAGVWE